MQQGVRLEVLASIIVDKNMHYEGTKINVFVEGLEGSKSLKFEKKNVWRES